METSEQEIKSSYLKIDGRFLVPGFSIYVLELEIVGKDGIYFYVGMTGDNYYPSARSALHRLAGHIDETTSSTQNQLLKGLKRIFEKKKDENLTNIELKRVNIKMHHYPIEGFKESGLKTMSKEAVRIYIESKTYKEDYKPMQDKVSKLEKALIFYFISIYGKDYVLNKTNNKGVSYIDTDGCKEIYESVKTEFGISSVKSKGLLSNHQITKSSN